MSAAKMVADSTQEDPDPVPIKSKKRKKKEKEKKANKKGKTQEKKKTKGKKESDEDSDLDLEKELKGIGTYINERQEMINQMFYSLRGQTLQRHIPDVQSWGSFLLLPLLEKHGFIELSIDDLKARCMEQLEVMSKKRIRRILTGDDPANISSSGTEDESTDEDENDVTAQDGEDHSRMGNPAAVKEDSEEDDGCSGEELEEEEAGSEEGEIRLRLPGDEGSDDDANQGDREQEGIRDEGESDSGEEPAQDFSINQMELLELEMRARAIKAMLKAQEVKDVHKPEEG